MVTKALMDEYTKHINTSEMIIEYYKNQTTAGLEKYFLSIENWLESDISPEENRPLVIQAEEGVGKKTLLAQWMKFHQGRSQKTHPDVIIPHFAGTGGNNANHYFALYKILINLREHFDISQKVELLESKLVHYFHYWLDVANRALIGKIVDDSNIILIFDGINMFLDPQTGEETNISLWLPSTFPSRIRVIVTTEPGTLAMKHFENSGCEIIKIQDEAMLPSTLISNLLARPSFITDPIYKTRVIEILKNKSQEVLRYSLYIKTYLSTLLPYPSDNIIKESDIDKEDFFKVFKDIDFEKLQGTSNIDELNIFLLEYFSKSIMSTDKFKALITALTITEKGLTEQELLTLVKVDNKEWKYLVAVFKTFFMTYKGLWKINNEPFKKAIHTYFLKDNSEYVKKLHEEIAEILQKTPNSIRKLEAQTYHLCGCKAYFKLKEALSNIENFLLLFNPNNKYELCRYWQILEQNGFDPSTEYIKSIEGFELHYRPNPEDTFMIVLQVTRFLKEFSDFETEATPTFRHPPIKGGKEIKEIGLRHEIKKMGMFLCENWEDDDDKTDEMEELEHRLSKEFPDYTEQMRKDLANQIYESTKKKQEEGTNSGYYTETQDNSGQNSKRHTRKKDPPILNAFEALNVDIPENREKFKKYYMEIALRKKQHSLEAQKDTKKQIYLDEGDEQVPQQQNDEPETIRKSLQSLKTLNDVGLSHALTDRKKDAKAQIEERLVTYQGNISEPIEEFVPTFYYYKRWMWMMFPLFCLSYKMNYSMIIAECFSSATKYMSVREEKEKTLQALKIAIEAKLKKQLILAKPVDSNSSLSKSTKPDLSTVSKSRKILPPIVSNSQHETSTPNLKHLDFSPVSSKSIKVEDFQAFYQKEAKESKYFMGRKFQKKNNQFFITSEFLDTSQFNNSASISKIEQGHDLYSSSVQLSTLEDMSPSNKDNVNKTPIKDKSLFASERRFENSLHKSNETVKAILLPKYQDSVLSYSAKHVGELESKIQHLSQSLNDTVYQTKVSAKKLKDFSVINSNLSQIGASELAEKSKIRSEEVNVQMEKAERIKAEALKQKERFESVLKVCLKNKKDDELYIRGLNHLLTNFNKLIAFEKKSTSDDTIKANELEKLSQEYISVYEEKLDTYDMLVRHVKSEKEATIGVNIKVGKVYSKLGKSAMDKSEEIKRSIIRNRERQEAESLKQSNMRDLMNVDGQNLIEMRSTMDQIDEKMGLDFDSPKFQGFMDYLEKIDEFEAGSYKFNEDIEKLKEEKQVYANFLDTLMKAKVGRKDQKKDTIISYNEAKADGDLQEKLRLKKKKAEELSRVILSTTKLVLDAQMALGKISDSLNIEKSKEPLVSAPIPTDKIVSAFEAKLTAVQEKLGSDTFEKFKQNKLDLNNYKSIKAEKDQLLVDQESQERATVFKQGKKYLEVVREELKG